MTDFTEDARNILKIVRDKDDELFTLNFNMKERNRVIEKEISDYLNNMVESMNLKRENENAD